MKKFLSMLMMLVTVLSLTACGAKNGASANDAKSVLESISKIEANSVECVLDVKVGAETMSFKIAGASKDESNAYVSILAKLNIEEYAMDDYVELTNVYYANGEEFYINIKQVLEFLTELDSQFAILSTYLALPGDYVMMTYDDLVELYAQMGVDMSDIDLSELAQSETDEEYVKLVVDVLGGFINDFSKNAGEDTVAVKDNKITVTINNDNAVAAMEALAAMDVEEYFMKLAEGIDKVEGGVSTTAAMKSDIEGLNDNIKSAAEDLKANGVGDDKVELNFAIGVDGSSVTMSADAKVDESGEETVIGFTYTAKPDKAENFSIPTSTMSLDDFMQMLSDLGVM